MNVFSRNLLATAFDDSFNTMYIIALFGNSTDLMIRKSKVKLFYIYLFPGLAVTKCKPSCLWHVFFNFRGRQAYSLSIYQSMPLNYFYLSLLSYVTAVKCVICALKWIIGNLSSDQYCQGQVFEAFSLWCSIPQEILF